MTRHTLIIAISMAIAWHSSYSKAAEEARSCTLGSSANGIVGTYWPDGRITFDQQPKKEWEFMATGTGVTGLVVSFPDEMLLQINHASAIDEEGKVRALARLHIDLGGKPFANAESFTMTTSLRRSTIEAEAKTATGTVRVEIRAHVPLDVIRIDIFDERKTPGELSLRFEEDAKSTLETPTANRTLFFHENADKGPGINTLNHTWLAGRTFGLCLQSSDALHSAEDNRLTATAAEHHVFYIVGASKREGRQAFLQTTTEQAEKVAAIDHDEFTAGHEAWWSAFWPRASFEPVDPDNRMIRYRAAFDLFRYYTACATSDRRETPARFQIDLYRYHLRQHDWLTMGLCAVEMYQSVFGTMRTGDWETLRSEFRFMQENLPFYKDHAQRSHGVEGAYIAMGHKPWVNQPGKPLDKADWPKKVNISDGPYNGNNPAGPLFMLALMCDYADLSNDRTFAEETMRPLATEVMTWFRQRYTDKDGRICFDPCNAGETWQFVRNPAEIVCAFRMLLPRLISTGQRLGWPQETIDAWQKMLAAAPPIPRGILKYDTEAHEVKPEILPGNLLVPAEDMSECKAYVLPWGGEKPWYNINGQHTELFAIWPAKLVLRDPADYAAAKESYEKRFWKHVLHGWTLDVVDAACLGLWDDVSEWFGKYFDGLFVLPCGLARETAPTNPACAKLPEYPSLQGMGTGVIPVFEMLLQDYADELIVLPCWPEDMPVQFTLYSPFAGKVRVSFEPGKRLLVETDRKIKVSQNRFWKSPVPIEHRVGEK